MRSSRNQSKIEVAHLAGHCRSNQFQASNFPLRENTLLFSGVALIMVSASMMLSTLIG
ncbi:MAG: hypothetical protein ACK4NV_20130 [Pannonibacter sp.]